MTDVTPQSEAPETPQEATPSREEQAAAADKAQQAKFMEHMAKAGFGAAKEPAAEEPAAKPATPRTSNGQFQSKSGKGSEDGENPDGLRTVALETDKDLEAALHALRRDHYTSEQIDLLGDASAIKKHAAAIIKKQSADDQAHTRVRELEKALEEATRQKPTEGNGEASPQAPPAAADLEKIKASLGVAFGDTDAEVLMEAIGASTGQANSKVAALEASLEQATATLQQMQGVVFEMQMQAIRREVQGRFPDLADNENWQTVRAQLSKLNPDAYQESSLEDMVADAARMVGLGGQPGGGSRRRTSDPSNLKDAGRTGTPTVAETPPAPRDSGFEEFKRHMAKAGFTQ